jgi:aminopeptidase N
MLRRRMGDQRFLAMLGDIVKRYDHASITTELFRKSAAQFLPPKSEDPTLGGFFDQWVYGTGIPTLKLTYVLKGQAPALRLVGTLDQSGVDEDFSVLTPVEIQIARGQSVTRWIASSNQPVTFTVALKQTPLKVALDPHNAVLRR